MIGVGLVFPESTRRTPQEYLTAPVIPEEIEEPLPEDDPDAEELAA